MSEQKEGKTMGRERHRQFGGFFEEWDDTSCFLAQDIESETRESIETGGHSHHRVERIVFLVVCRCQY